MTLHVSDITPEDIGAESSGHRRRGAADVWPCSTTGSGCPTAARCDLTALPPHHLSRRWKEGHTMTTRTQSIDRPVVRPGVADVEQHPLVKSVVLHLLPGILTGAVFYAVAPAVMRAGYPAIAGAVIAVGLVLVTAELGWLLREAHQRTGAWAITAVLPFRPGSFSWRKAGLVTGLLAWGFAVSLLGIGGSFEDSFFSWMPGWARDPITGVVEGVSTATIVTFVGYVVFLVVLGPLVEELYFRGYLLPRIGRFGAWAALINVSLFALYHLWKPWDVINLIIILGPMVYVVWRTKDIRIGIALHIALNSISLLNVAPALLS
jgi:membrane protease YdiL (CAAX protease family)